MVHGDRCAEASSSCPITVAGIVQVIQQVGIGLDMSVLQLTLTAGGQLVLFAEQVFAGLQYRFWPPAVSVN